MSLSIQSETISRVPLPRLAIVLAIFLISLALASVPGTYSPDLSV